MCSKDHPIFLILNRCVFNVFLRERDCGSREGKAGMRSQGMSVGGAEMVRRCSRRYGLAIGLIFTTGRRNAREYKGILCRGSPVPLCKGDGTKQLKVEYFACATCVLQNVDSHLQRLPTGGAHKQSISADIVRHSRTPREDRGGLEYLGSRTRGFLELEEGVTSIHTNWTS